MKLNAKRDFAIAFLALALLSLACGKDKKTTNPQSPSFSVTLNGEDLTFQTIVAVYLSSTHELGIEFDQTDRGRYPDALIVIENAHAVEVNEPTACHLLVTMAVNDYYGCGGGADDDDAVATLTFTRLQLTNGGLVSGHLEGLAEHVNHPGENLRSINMEFANIPVQMY